MTLVKDRFFSAKEWEEERRRIEDVFMDLEQVSYGKWHEMKRHKMKKEYVKAKYLRYHKSMNKTSVQRVYTTRQCFREFCNT